ncbi:MAG: PmoA family protein, partial [Planctomycetota bacterium]
RGDQVVLTYNKQSPPVPDGIDAIYNRSGCLHPVMTPNGRVITDMFPKDHPHQHGIFTAWVKTSYKKREIDFWNLAKGTGRVLHERVVSTKQPDGQAELEVDLIHRAEQEPQVNILRERWKITVYQRKDSYNCVDLELKQTALTDTPLIIKQNRYGGFALRACSQWLTSDDKDQAGKGSREPSSFLNDLGSDRIKGNHQKSKWVALTGEIDGQPATIAVLSHPSNFRSPQTVRLHPTKPYFAYSPCVDGKFQIDRKNPYSARYRVLITDDAPDSTWLDKQWDEWVAQ